jgi:hypothetical protein
MVIWKVIKGFEKYEVSNHGQIRNVKTKYVLAQFLGGNGYYKVGLWNHSGEKKRLMTHRLVAVTFCDNKNNKPVINHIDGNKTNNNSYNLEWCTHKENIRHAYDLGLMIGTDHNKCKKLGKTSKYHYVEEVKSCGEHYFRCVVKLDSTLKGKFSRSRQFSVKKYGKKQAEKLAAKAVNEIIKTHSEFEGLALNVL